MSFSTKSYATNLEMFRRGFANHTLEEHPGPAGLTCILRPPSGGHCESTMLIFTGDDAGKVPGYIVVMGDLCPGANGVVSNIGYGVGWFAARKSEGYLCEKFLRKVWVPELALAALRQALQDERDAFVDADRAEVERITKRVEALEEAIEEAGEDASGDVVAESTPFYEAWTDIYDDSPEDQGYGYDPKDAALLVAIQETFARLYAAAHPERQAA